MNNVLKTSRIGRPRLVEEQVTAVALDLVDIAVELIRKGGGQALTARAVAEAASMTVSKIYRYVPDLETLRLAANAVTMTRLREALTEAASRRPHARPDERLVDVGEAYVAFARANHNSWAAVFDRRTGELPGSMSDDISRMFSAVETILGDVRGLDPDLVPTVTKALWASVHGMVYLGEVGGLGPVGKDDVLPMMRSLVRFAVLGMGVDLEHVHDGPDWTSADESATPGP